MVLMIRGARLFAAGVFAAVTAASGAQAQDDFAAKTKAARDYVEGRLNAPEYNITYTGAPITIRLSSFVPAATPLWPVWRGAFKQLEKESKGKLLIKDYPGGVLHAMADGFKAVRSGITDMTHCYVSYQPTSFQLMHGTALSGLFPDAVVGATVATRL